MNNLSFYLLELSAYQLRWFDYGGYLGSFLTSITFIPQVYKAWKTKSVGLKCLDDVYRRL